MKKLKIVITGGPSGGKTTLIEALQKDFKGKINVVPEAASILYRGGFPRRSSEQEKVHTQRAIYYVQRELEALAELDAKNITIICDRGSLDSLAYVSMKSSEFLQALGTNEITEIKRYDWVIHLDTANEDSFANNNPIRIENYKEALELNVKTLQAWKTHPHRVIIPHNNDFLEKISAAKQVITKILSGATMEEIQKLS